MTALTDALAKPNITKVFLLEVTAGEHLKHWTLDTGSTYYASSVHDVIDVLEDGSSLTEQASIALVRSNAGSWYYDEPNDRVYVHATAGADPYTKTLQAIVQFYFANHPKRFNNNYYASLLESVPNLSLRIERTFSGVSQISGGACVFNNSAGDFDALSDLQWDAGSVTLKLGADDTSEMAYGDYETIGKWLTLNWAKDDAKFSLALKEYKIRVKNKIPTAEYDRDTYASIREDDIGKSIPVAYGVVRDVAPALINSTTRTFKVAGHAIYSLDAVRVKNESTGAWETKTFASTDLANAEFTLSVGNFPNDDVEVAVDFIGKKTGSIPMDNASDVIKDMLTVELGEPSANIDSTAFTNAYNALDGGSYADGTHKTHKAIGLYIDKPLSVESIAQAINQAVGSYLFATSGGKFIYKVFEPVVGEGLTEFTTAEILSFKNDTNNRAIISKAIAHYDKRHLRKWAEYKSYEVGEKQYLHGMNTASIKEKDLPLSDDGDAEKWAQEQVNFEGEPQKAYTIVVPGRLVMTKFPGDFVRMVYARHDINDVFEVMGISHNLLADTATLNLLNNHGLGDRAGFWVSDAAVLPTRFSDLDGYGLGSLVWNDAWDPEIKKWVRQNVGYWCDDNGFASVTDPDSLNVSTWI